jgi:hypothetical protein
VCNKRRFGLKIDANPLEGNAAIGHKIGLETTSKGGIYDTDC